MTDQQGNAGGQAGQAGQPPQDPHQPPGQWGPPQQGQWGSPPPPPGQPGQQWQPSNPVPPAPQKSWFARHKILTTVLALVVLFGIVGVAGGGGGESTAAEDTTGSGEGTGGSAQEGNDSGQDADASQDDSGNVGGEATQNDGSTTSESTKVDPEPKRDSANEGVLRVTVESTGSDSGSVTFMQPDASMQFSQNTDASFPWSKTWRDVDSLPMGWNMNAQQNGGGKVTCTVELDGQVVAQNTSSGSYAMVTCSK